MQTKGTIDRNKGLTYYGGQRSAGHFQNLINIIPKSDIYIEGFLGLSGVFSNIVNDENSKYIGFDLLPEIIDRWNKIRKPNEFFFNSCYSHIANILSMFPEEKKFVHFDPPYRKTRSPKLYVHDLKTDDDFLKLINFIKSIQKSCSIVISHPKDELFDILLNENGWSFIYFETNTRNGLIPNGCYINYDSCNIELADYSYIGQDFTDRQRIQRKLDRYQNKINSLPIDERKALLKILNKNNH